jgi:hypothetical protein
MREPFDAFARELVAAGLPIPAPLKSAMEGEFLPLAITTREAWPRWAREHGHNDQQIETLSQAVGRLVRHPNYIEAMAADLSERVDIEGKGVQRVRPEDRLSASMILLWRGFKASTRAAAPPNGAKRPPLPVPAPPPGPAPAPAAAPAEAAPQARASPSGRPVLSLKKVPA